MLILLVALIVGFPFACAVAVDTRRDVRAKRRAFVLERLARITAPNPIPEPLPLPDSEPLPIPAVCHTCGCRTDRRFNGECADCWYAG